MSDIVLSSEKAGILALDQEYEIHIPEYLRQMDNGTVYIRPARSGEAMRRIPSFNLTSNSLSHPPHQVQVRVDIHSLVGTMRLPVYLFDPQKWMPDAKGAFRHGVFVASSWRALLAHKFVRFVLEGGTVVVRLAPAIPVAIGGTLKDSWENYQ